MAIKAQGSRLQVEASRAATKIITGITAANPPVVTSAAHGYANGAIVYIDGVAGMVEVNKRAFVVANQAANTFELRGIDGSAYTAYGSGGTAALITLADVGEVVSSSGFDGEAADIDTTNLRSTAKEALVGLQDYGNVALGLLVNTTDVGQLRLKRLKALGQAAVFSLTLSDAKVAAFVGLVKSFSFNAAVDGAVTGDCSLKVTGEPSEFV